MNNFAQNQSFSVPVLPDSTGDLENRFRNFFWREHSIQPERADSTGLIIGNMKYFIRIIPNPTQREGQLEWNRWIVPGRGWKFRYKNP